MHAYATDNEYLANVQRAAKSGDPEWTAHALREAEAVPRLQSWLKHILSEIGKDLLTEVLKVLQDFIHQEEAFLNPPVEARVSASPEPPSTEEDREPSKGSKGGESSPTDKQLFESAKHPARTRPD